MSVRTPTVLAVFLLCTGSVTSTNSHGLNKTESSSNSSVPGKMMYTELTYLIDKGFKSTMKEVTKNLLPHLMRLSSETNLSSSCQRSLMKYVIDLTKAKVWAVKMLDATSKVPAGFLAGTMTDFGDLDECLDVAVYFRDGSEDFRGSFCSFEAGFHMPPKSGNFSASKMPHARFDGTVGEELRSTIGAFHYMHLSGGLCVPSSCSLHDIRMVLGKVSDIIHMDIKVPVCYVREGVKLRPIHIAVIVALSILFLLAFVGTVLEYQKGRAKEEVKETTGKKILLTFSVVSNFNGLIAPSKRGTELKCLHGLRTLSMAWVMLGHTYIWMDHKVVKRLIIMEKWMSTVSTGPLTNAFLCVEPFFFLSGLLTSYISLQIMSKTKGKLNVPLFVLVRYMRLAPTYLLAMGLLFFLPLISSGPFAYSILDLETESCRRNWWANMAFVANWLSYKTICIHPTWFLSADFQLTVLSILVLIPLYRCPPAGFTLLFMAITGSTAGLAAIIYTWDLPPTVQLSSGDTQRIIETIDRVHISTITHVGPYCIGVIVGYLILKYKDIKLTKLAVVMGWCTSFVLSTSAVYGLHKWTVGEGHGAFVSILYGSVHRSVFVLGIAWVAFACVSGYGGVVNSFLSCLPMIILSKMTYTVFLLHALVLWTRMSGMRERMYLSHYNIIYEFAGSVVTCIVVALPFYLLLEAPLANLKRLALSRVRLPKDEDATETSPDVKLRIVNRPPEVYTNTQPTSHPNTLGVLPEVSIGCSQRIFQGLPKV